MKLSNFFIALFTSLFITSMAQGKDLMAIMETNMGTIEIQLAHDKAPKTVSNFVTLARKGFYNGLTFHRVIPKFMIQGGDPKGNGTGGPGYKFKDEFHPSLNHKKPFVISMANSGPDTNGSQFFITVAPTPHLDNRHAVFGTVTKGSDIAVKISETKTQGSRPAKPVIMKKVSIKGDWFKPAAVDIVKELTKEEVEKFSKNIVTNLSKKVSEALNLGKLNKAVFVRHLSKGSLIQVTYDLNFSDHKQVSLVAFGHIKNNKLAIKDFQFSKR